MKYYGQDPHLAQNEDFLYLEYNIFDGNIFWNEHTRSTVSLSVSWKTIWIVPMSHLYPLQLVFLFNCEWIS